MKNLIYSISVCILLSSCGLGKSDADPKQKEIMEQFKAKMLELCQKSGDGMNKIATELENGTSVDSIDQALLDNVQSIEKEIQEISATFRKDVKEYEIDEDDFKASHKELRECFKTVKLTHKELKKAGVSLN